MSTVSDWILIVGLVVVFNAMPVFAPPTVALLAYFQVIQEKDPVYLALLGGAGATAGKVILAYASRVAGDRFVPDSRRRSIEQLANIVRSRRSLGLSYLVLFAIGPIPKSTLFMAVGFARISPLPGAIVFGTTRAGFYLVSLLAVDTAATSIRGLFDLSIAGPASIILQILSLIAVVLLFRIDFDKLLDRFPRLGRWVDGIKKRLPTNSRPNGTQHDSES